MCIVAWYLFWWVAARVNERETWPSVLWRQWLYSNPHLLCLKIQSGFLKKKDWFLIDLSNHARCICNTAGNGSFLKAYSLSWCWWVFNSNWPLSLFSQNSLPWQFYPEWVYCIYCKSVTPRVYRVLHTANCIQVLKGTWFCKSNY